jgi:hypothetical protein
VPHHAGIPLEHEQAFIELTHQTRDGRAGDRLVRGRIRLVSTVPTYGGRRWWFQCPRTRRRTTKLFLPNGGRHFWSRQAYGLGYTCRREERADRFRRWAVQLCCEGHFRKGSVARLASYRDGLLLAIKTDPIPSDVQRQVNGRLEHSPHKTTYGQPLRAKKAGAASPVRVAGSGRG